MSAPGARVRALPGGQARRVLPFFKISMQISLADLDGNNARVPVAGPPGLAAQNAPRGTPSRFGRLTGCGRVPLAACPSMGGWYVPVADWLQNASGDDLLVPADGLAFRFCATMLACVLVSWLVQKFITEPQMARMMAQASEAAEHDALEMEGAGGADAWYRQVAGCSACGKQHERNLCCAVSRLQNPNGRELHWGKLELITWGFSSAVVQGVPFRAGSEMGWGGTPVAASEGLRAAFEARNMDLVGLHSTWPQGLRWTCCGAAGDNVACCNHHAIGCTCVACARLRAGASGRPVYTPTQANRFLSLPNAPTTPWELCRGVRWTPQAHRHLPASFRQQIRALLLCWLRTPMPQLIVPQVIPHLLVAEAVLAHSWLVYGGHGEQHPALDSTLDHKSKLKKGVADMTAAAQESMGESSVRGLLFGLSSDSDSDDDDEYDRVNRLMLEQLRALSPRAAARAAVAVDETLN